MFKKLTLAALLTTTAFAGNVAADDHINAWKHCGIGAMIFDDNGTAAAIVNLHPNGATHLRPNGAT